MKKLIIKNRFLRTLLSDETYMRWQYELSLKKPLNLENPQTFNEKIQWTKLNWRVPLLTQCADKYAVREYVEARIGLESLKQLYGVYRRPEDIDPAKLPEKFMLKTNHGCGQNIACRNKAEFDWTHTRRLLKRFLKNNLFQHGREWAYKNIPARIICEEYIEATPLMDLNFFCFDGVPRFVEVITDRLGIPRVGMFDLEWNLLERKYATAALEGKIEKPPHFDKMVADAAKLAQGFAFVRVDFFYDGKRVYFGEMTFYPRNGVNVYQPESFDAYLGSFLKLPARCVTP